MTEIISAKHFFAVTPLIALKAGVKSQSGTHPLGADNGLHSVSCSVSRDILNVKGPNDRVCVYVSVCVCVHKCLCYVSCGAAYGHSIPSEVMYSECVLSNLKQTQTQIS